MRRTEQKQAIRAALVGAGRPLSAQEVLERASEAVPSLGLATVYRNLKGLTDEGWLQPVELAGQPTRFERAHLKHHHHFLCQACERLFDVPGCEMAGHGHGLPAGFEVARHEITYFGRCADCADRAERSVGVDGVGDLGDDPPRTLPEEGGQADEGEQAEAADL